jgi:hypothetical protein
MAGRVQWRRFGFFDRDTVNENIEGTLVTKNIHFLQLSYLDFM